MKYERVYIRTGPDINRFFSKYNNLQKDQSVLGVFQHPAFKEVAGRFSNDCFAVYCQLFADNNRYPVVSKPQFVKLEREPDF